MEKILSIKEILDVVTDQDMYELKIGDKFPFKTRESGSLGFDGYQIDTSEHRYYLLIRNGQCCCENWGYFASNNNFEEFIGKNLLSVELTDLALNTKAVDDSGYRDDAGGIQFVNFRMSDGSVLQFAVYNAHNGYYGHNIVFLKDEEVFHKDRL